MYSIFGSLAQEAHVRRSHLSTNHFCGPVKNGNKKIRGQPIKKKQKYGGAGHSMGPLGKPKIMELTSPLVLATNWNLIS
jgi:hypothetical protein